MSSPIMPVAKSIFLCDDVLYDSSTGKIHMIGVFNAIRVKSPATYPFRPKQLCVVGQFIGGMGDYSFRVEITDPAAGEGIYSVVAGVLRFPTRHTSVYACVRITECVFPGPGDYVVEMYVNDLFIEDRLLILLGEESAS